MNVVILTSSLNGSASSQMKELLKSKSISVKMVIFSKGEVVNKKDFYKKKIKKIFKIGLFGAWNGLRMREWYGAKTKAYLEYESIDKMCQKYQIPFKITPSINCKSTVDLFKDSKAELGLSLGNGYIGAKIFTTPKFGMLNIHHEELPAYQNAQSIIWQIYNGSQHTGYTIHKINKKIDQGEIIYAEKIPLEFKNTLADTVAFNYAKLWESSAIGLVKVLENFETYFNNGTAQGHGKTYTTPSLLQYLKIWFNYKRLSKTR